MYRFFSAVALCLLMLIVGLFVFLPYTRAADNPIIALLNLPAPPPPNPLVKSRNNYIGNEVAASKSAEPPSDEVPIEELTAFWTSQNSSYNAMDYSPPMSERAASRILSELEKKPEDVINYLNVLPDSPEVVEKIKVFYDRGFAKPKSSEDGDDYSPKDAVKVWLMNHSKYYSDELLKSAQQVHDDRQYVTNQDQLLALAHVDWDKAEPLVSRLYNDSSQPVSQTLARWVYYKHALETDSSGDVDKYRDELQKTVENKSAGPGIRDLAMDALVKEKDWKGRDDWYYSLLDDETLYDLRVNGQSFTGLTTLIRASKSGKYTPKMLELVNSGSPAVRGMAVRNLAQYITADHPEVVTALLPWLENAKWAGDNDGSRRRIVEALATLRLPESVPGLLALLNEKPATRNSMMNTNRMMSNSSTGNINVDSNYVDYVDSSPYRSAIIAALGKQKDARAIAPVRQILPELQDYERTAAVGMLLACGGFSTIEQVDALESVAKIQGVTNSAAPMSNMMSANRAMILDEEIRTDDDDDDSDQPTAEINPRFSQSDIRISSDADVVSNSNMAMTNSSVYGGNQPRVFTANDLKRTLGQVVINDTEPEEPLVAATIDRINVLDREDPQTANNLRTILQSWHGTAVNSFLLKDLKNGKIDADAIVKLLSLRKELREKQSGDVYDVRSGTPTALGISTCLIENDNEYDAILAGKNTEAKTAMLACARLIRAKLPVQKVAENLKSSDQLLAVATERYLESEDSPAARNIVLSLYPNEAKILGATLYFSRNQSGIGSSEFLSNLFSSLATADVSAPVFFGYGDVAGVYKTEKRLQKEILTDPKLLGIYAYDSNFVRIYGNQVVYSWEEDDSRYRERTLEPAEFENLKNYLTSQNVNELPPFLSDCEECSSKELLMLGKQGGRRIFEHAEDTPDFFGGLNQIFEQMRVPPAHLRYRLEKDLAGLEILYADDNLKAQTVWKSTGDLRVLIENQKLREQIDEDLRTQENLEEQAETFDPETAEPMRRKRREQREYENYSWRKIANGQLGEIAAQPPQIEYIPKRDNLAIAAQPEQWKRRTTNFELRNNEEGIYKITRGQITKIRSGYYAKLLVTPDGRWAFATSYSDVAGLVRINLLTNKESPMQRILNYPPVEAVAFVPSLNKLLVFSGYYGEDQEVADRQGSYLLLDPETGAMQPAKGEVRPLAQQTFRPLQPTAKPDEFWAAIPDADKNRTTFGIYNTKTLTFKTLLKIPKISFDSMNMWVDEAEKKIYFVYDGHLLALPMGK